MADEDKQLLRLPWLWVFAFIAGIGGFYNGWIIMPVIKKQDIQSEEIVKLRITNAEQDLRLKSLEGKNEDRRR